MNDDVTAVQDIKQHKPQIDLDDDENDETIDTPCLAVRNLDQGFNNGSDEMPSPQDPPRTDILLLEFKLSSPTHSNSNLAILPVKP